ncbi:uncharacterized protein LOC123525084 [Mercenaria mercenaria]|uniref:uncharacterized protein LOC123525084 n=1 Tax=Mercenaria mercenaria TaxID=6596 RepID=UPI00234F092B|nr:uncharacterized protein LOC123525084 [Mercenaria mercenaria]
MAGRAVILLARTICLCTAMFGVMSQDGSTAETKHYEEERLLIDCNLKRLLAGHTYNSMKDICGDGYRVEVMGLSYDKEAFPEDSFPWTFEMALMTDLAESTAVISRQFHIDGAPPSDNITGIISDFFAAEPQRSITIPRGKCDNRDGIGMMKLYSGTREFSGKGYFMVLCDFSEYDLKLAVTNAADNSYIGGQVDTPMAMAVDWTTTSVSDLVTKTPLADLKVVVEGNVPLLEPEDTCVFAIAYLTAAPKDMKAAGEEYTKPTDAHYNDDGMTNDHSPKITYHDTLIGTPICLREAANNEEHDLLQIVKDSSDVLNLCGNYTLVLEVDPFRTLHNEQNKTNNVIAFNLQFRCAAEEKPPSKCEILTNGFGGGRFQSFDTRILFHGSKKDDETSKIHRYTQLFSQEEKSWGSLVSYRDDPRGLQKHGFGLLKVYNKYLMSEFSESECGDFDNDAEVQSTISHIEGLDEENLKAKAGLAELYPPLNEAKMKLVSLETTDDSEVIKQIRNEAWQSLENLVHPGSESGILDFAKQLSLKSAYNMTMMLADAILSGTDKEVMRYYANLEMCMVSIGLEYLPYLFHMMQDPNSRQDAFNGVMDIVGNLTRIVFSARYFYPEFTCQENMLTNLLDFLRILDPENPREEAMEWLFDSDQVRDIKMNGEKLAFNDCGLRMNKCVKKLQSVCAVLEHADYMVKPVAENEKDVCVAKYLKKKAEEQYRILGLLGLKDQMEDKDMNDKCRNDPFAPQKGPLTLYAIVDETVGQVVYKGFPSLDSKYFIWKKEAICTCTKCHRDMDMKKK